MRFLPHSLAEFAGRMNARIRLVRTTLGLVLAASGKWTLFWGLLLVALGLMPAALVSAMRLLTDAIFELLQRDGVSRADFTPVLWLVGLTATLMVTQQLLQSAMGWVRAAQGELIQDHLHELVHERALAIDLAFFESAEYNDRLYQASKELTSRPLALLESVGSLLQNGISLVALAALLVPYGFWLPLLLFVAALPAFLVANAHNRRYHAWWEAATTDRRWLQYYETLMTVDSIAPEMRLYGLGGHFRGLYRAIRLRLRTGLLKLTRDQSVQQFVSSLGAMVVSGGALLWMLWRATQGLVTAGDIVLFYQALSRGQSQLQTLMGNLSQLQRHTLYLQGLFDFLALQPTVTDPAVPVTPPQQVMQGITLHDVSFRYPGTTNYVLQNFSLTIPAGKIVAIVGFNGAGKSTLVKLLCRFYDPEQGSIQIDGVDVRTMRQADLRRLLSCMMQFPVPYVATVEDNIGFGDLARRHDQEALNAAADAAGAQEFIERLPQGYDTLLGKLFPQGAQLSGGEWQRLALARAFFRQGQVLVLDEPTSMMDLWSELDWFERFRQLAQGRTSLLITHRFLTAMRADLIFVMDHGEIVESGTHAELLARNGLYAQAWRDQWQGETQNGEIDAGEAPIPHSAAESILVESAKPVG